MSASSEPFVEDATLAWLASLGYTLKHGPEIAPGEAGAERTEDGLVVPAPVKSSPERFRAASRRKIEN